MSTLQTWLLYKNAISSGVAIDDILKYARRTKDDAHQNDSKNDNLAAITELRQQLAAQDTLIKDLLAAKMQNLPAASSLPVVPMQAESILGNEIPRISSRVHFEENPASVMSVPSKKVKVPVRKPFASSSTSKLKDIGDELPYLSPEELEVMSKTKEPEDTASNERKRPSTLHAILKIPDNSNFSEVHTFGSSSMQEQTHVMYPLSPKGMQQNNSFPVRSMAKTGGRGVIENVVELQDCAPTKVSSEAFVFKVPDALPPRINSNDGDMHKK